jgi:hypothetical protein
MTDSVWGLGSVVVGGEVTAGVAEVPVVPEAGSERKQALGDARDQAGHGVGAVALERELAFDRVDDRLDPLAHTAEVAEAGRLVLAVGAQKTAPSSAISASKCWPAKRLSAITV